jgi:ribonuclease HI
MIEIKNARKSFGKLEVLKYAKDKKMLPTLMLWLGRNLYVDVIFAKKETFIKEIYNYLEKSKNIEFIKVKGHAGEKDWNDCVDKLAVKAKMEV